MKKKLTSLILILSLILSIVLPVTAADNGTYLKEAEQLQVLGVFQGTSNGFELDRQPTRLEGLVMLIRLLGKETEAKALNNQPCPFTDVPEWGMGYANYAYKYGLSKGVGNNLFGSNDNMNAQSYVTFMLRSLEYDDGKGDFSYDQAIDFAKGQGVLTINDVSELTSKKFLRDHVAKVSMLSLLANRKGKSTTLLEKLVDEGAISRSVADKINETNEPNLEVYFIDVGQADAMLIKKGNEFMLIDAGNNADGTVVVNYLKNQNVSKLKYVVATHPHEDHIGGLDDVIDAFEIEKIIMSNAISTTKTFEDVLDSINRKGLTITKAKAGDRYDLNGAVITILAPNQESYTDLNNLSVVVKVVNGSNSFLFTGDAEELSEAQIIEKNRGLLKADILKVGHHGSTSSTTKAFLDTVNPTYAIITVGADNNYGHPNQEILDRLAAKGIQTYRTDLQGTIIAISDGMKISFDKKPSHLTPVTSTPPVVGEATPNLIISKLDKIGEVVTIKNNSTQDVNLKGWKLLSVTGNQKYIFPHYILKSNSTVTVASGGSNGDLVWGKGNIWNNSSSDPAVLYDAQDNQVFRFDD